MHNAAEWNEENPRPWSSEERTTNDTTTQSENVESHPRTSTSSSASSSNRANAKPQHPHTRDNGARVPSRSHQKTPTSRKPSRRSERREKARLENLIGREYSLVNNGEEMSVRVTIGAKEKFKPHTTSKIWTETDDNGGFQRGSHMPSRVGSRLSNRKVKLDPNSERETLLFSREGYNVPLSPNGGGGEGFAGSSSPIAAGNEVLRKRKDAHLTAKLFQQQIDKLTHDTLRPKKKKTTQQESTSVRFASKPRERERLTTPLSGSGLMGGALERTAVEVQRERRVLERQERQERQHRETRETRKRQERQGKAHNTHRTTDVTDSNTDKRRLLTHDDMQVGGSPQRPPLSGKNQKKNNKNQKKHQKHKTDPDSKVVTTHVFKTMEMNMQFNGPEEEEAQASSSSKPQHPGQATFIAREQLLKTPPSLSVGAIRGKVPAMGKINTSKTHSKGGGTT